MACYANADFFKPPVARLHAPEISFNWGLAKPHPALAFHGYGVCMSARMRVEREAFTGTLLIPCRDSVRLYVDGELLIDSWGGNRQSLPGVPFAFSPDQPHDVLLEYWNDGDGRSVTLSCAAHDLGSLDRNDLRRFVP